MAKNKKSSTIGSALRRMFGMQKKQLSFQEEEALQSPGRVIAQKLLSPAHCRVWCGGVSRNFPVCYDWTYLYAH